jgi:hypothetical protein
MKGKSKFRKSWSEICGFEETDSKYVVKPKIWLNIFFFNVSTTSRVNLTAKI